MSLKVIAFDNIKTEKYKLHHHKIPVFRKCRH